MNDELTALREATRTLARAAEAADVDGVERAISLRGRLVEALAARLAELDPSERRRVAAGIAADADDAARALAGLARAGREALARLRGRAGAMRGYGSGANRHPSALDRST